MPSYLAAFVLIAIGIFLFYIMVKSGTHYYVIMFTMFLMLGLTAYVLTDTVKEPEIVKNPDNSTTLKCNEGFTYRPEKNDCFNPSPFGHSILPLFGIIFGMFAFATIAENTFRSWRMYLTPKILYFTDRYQDENKPIPKHIDVYRQGDFVWMYRGFGALITSKEDEIHIAHRDMVYEISNVVVVKGKRQRVTPQALYQYLNKNERIFRQIMAGYDVDYRAHKFNIPLSEQPKIFIPLPLSYKEYQIFSSIKGNYGIGANRFKKVISELFKMRKAIEILDAAMSGTSKKTLTTAVELAGKSAVIGGEVSKLRQQEVAQPKYPRPEEMKYGEKQEER